MKFGLNPVRSVRIILGQTRYPLSHLGCFDIFGNCVNWSLMIIWSSHCESLTIRVTRERERERKGENKGEKERKRQTGKERD